MYKEGIHFVDDIENHFSKKNTFIVHCTLSIVHSNTDLSVKLQTCNNPHRFAEPPERGHEGENPILYKTNPLLPAHLSTSSIANLLVIW